MLHGKTMAVGTEHRVMCKRELEIDWARSGGKILTDACPVSSRRVHPSYIYTYIHLSSPYLSLYSSLLSSLLPIL